MGAASGFEQMMLELVNSARMDPRGDFARYITRYDDLRSNDSDISAALNYFNVDGDLLKQQVNALKTAAPLAWNSKLNNAATKHSERMVEQDTQSHRLPGEDSLGDRVRDEGYQYSRVGENVFAYSESALYAHAGFMVDWGPGTGGIQAGAGHRVNIMNADYREIGIGVVKDNDSGTDVGPYVVTQNLGTRLSGPETIVLGVVYDDEDDDGFYSIGEGAGNVKVTVGGASDRTPGAGGFAVETSAGKKEVRFSGDALDNAVTVKAVLKDENAKIDLIDGKLIKTTVSLELKSGGKHAELYGNKDRGLTGNGEANRLTGNKGDNTLEGRGGKDQLEGKAGRDRLNGQSGDDDLRGGDGKDKLDGGKGNDKLTGGAKADTFIFREDYGKDRITDFKDDLDIIKLDEALWGGGLSAKQVLNRYAERDSGDIVLDFGADELTIKDFTGMVALEDDILIV